MSYDFDDCEDRSPPRADIVEMEPTDLEALVTVLEIAAIFLTKDHNSTFTESELFSEAQLLVNDPLNETDLRLVLRGMDTIECVDNKLRLK